MVFDKRLLSEEDAYQVGGESVVGDRHDFLLQEAANKIEMKYDKLKFYHYNLKYTSREIFIYHQIKLIKPELFTFLMRLGTTGARHR